jgi:5-methyltetrahydrofolate--homocysteine methyltransferase
MKSLRERLKQPGIIVGDGAMGTMLLQRGLKPGECPERMALERPEVLEEIASLYLAAGAEIIETNTFGGSPLKLEPYGLDGKTEEVNRRAVAAVRKSIDDKAYLSASCGPSGRMLEPYGDAGEELVFNSFQRQARAIISEGVDMVCVETMTDLTEATLAVKAVKSISASIPVCATMTFTRTPGGFFTLMGTSIDQAVKGLTEAGAEIIGSNCGSGIEMMIEIAKVFVAKTSLPVIIQSNAGIPTLHGDIAVYPDSPQFVADQSRSLMKLGVKIIGGCCGTTPEHIAALKRAVEGFHM